MRARVMLRIVLEENVTVLIPSLFKLFPLKLVEELLDKIMCLWGSFISLGVLMAVEILRALDLAKSMKGLGLRRFRKEFSI